MEDITLTDEQRVTLIDRVRTYSASERERLGEAHEALVQWDELADIVAQEGPLPLDPVTTHRLHEVFENESWDPVPDVRKRLDQTPEHMLDVVRAVSSAWRDPEMWGDTPVPDPSRTAPEVLRTRVTSMFDDLEQNHRPGGGWRRVDPNAGVEGVVDLGVDTWTVSASSTEPEMFIWEIESPRDDITQGYGTASYDEVVTLLSDAIDRDAKSRGLDNPQQMPVAAELVPRIAASFRRADWSLEEDATFAQTIEFNDDSRIKVWDSADFMGSIEGYTWDVETYDAKQGSWVLTEQHETPGTLLELRKRIAQFHGEGQDRFDRSIQGLRKSVTAARTPEAAAMRLLEYVERQEARITQLETQLESTAADLQQTRDALLSVGKKLVPVRRDQEQRRKRDMDTGPVAEPAKATGPEMSR